MVETTQRQYAEFFHATGYLRIPSIISSSEVAVLRQTWDSFTHSDAGVKTSVDRVRVDGVVSSHAVFGEVATADRVLDAIEPLLGPNIELIENRHNHLTMFIAPTEDRLHRDVLQWTRSLLTVLVYLSDCTETDSATRVVPCSHLWPCCGRPNNGGTWMDEATPYAELEPQAVAVPARAGDAVVMHGQLYHAGAGMSAAGPRIVLTLAYRSVDELADGPQAGARLVRGHYIHRGRGAVRV